MQEQEATVTFEAYMEVLNAIGTSQDVLTEAFFKENEKHLPGLFEHLEEAFQGEIAAGQLTENGLANYTFGAFTLDENSRKALLDLYKSPVHTTELGFLDLEHSALYSHWTSHHIANIIVMDNDVEPSNPKLIVGCGGPAQIILEIIKYIEAQ
jgi:hypothetical protein